MREDQAAERALMPGGSLRSLAMRRFRMAAALAAACLVVSACAESDRYRSRSYASYRDYIGGSYGRSSGYMSPYDCWRSSSRTNCP